MISRITEQAELPACIPVLQHAFCTVAKQFNLTEENCPTNAAFITQETLASMFAKNIEMYKLIDADELCGFVAIEASGKESGTFYLEKLAVLPGKRHVGLGSQLIEFAIDRVKELDGTKVSIAIIDENIVLKNWYKKFGFEPVTVKKFSHLPFTVCFMDLFLKGQEHA